MSPEAAVSADAAITPPCRDSRIEAVVCSGRPGCHLEDVVAGGKSREGADLFVAMVTLQETTKLNEPCTPHDVWLITAAGSDMKASHRLVQTCTKTPVQSIRSLGPRQVRFVKSEEAKPPNVEPSSWFSATWGKDYALDPPELTGSFWEKTYWDYRDFEGATCDHVADDRCVAPALTLPMVDTGDDFEAGGWRTTSLGDCSMRLGRVYALLSRRALYIDVHEWMAPTDQIRIHLSPPEALPSEMVVWSLGMDGSLTRQAGSGKPAAAGHVEMSSEPSVRRFRLTDVWNGSVRYGHITYHDRSSGELGEVRKIEPSDAVCIPERGALRVTRKHRDFPPSEEITE